MEKFWKTVLRISDFVCRRGFVDHFEIQEMVERSSVEYRKISPEERRIAMGALRRAVDLGNSGGLIASLAFIGAAISASPDDLARLSGAYWVVLLFAAGAALTLVTRITDVYFAHAGARYSSADPQNRPYWGVARDGSEQLLFLFVWLSLVVCLAATATALVVLYCFLH